MSSIAWCLVLTLKDFVKVLTLIFLVFFVVFVYLYAMPIAVIHGMVAFAFVLKSIFPRIYGKYVPWNSLGFNAAFFVFLLLISLITVPVSLVHMNQQTSKMYKKIELSGPESLTYLEKSSIYMLGLWSIVLAAPIYPEVSLEFLYMYWPKSQKQQTFESNFAMKSKKVRKLIFDLIQQAKTQPAKNTVIIKNKVIWWKNYLVAHDEKRVALALNRLTVNAVAKNTGELIVVDAEGMVDISYPKKARVSLLKVKGYSLDVEEGLFWALQEVQWLYPYTARWIWQLKVPMTDDS